MTTADYDAFVILLGTLASAFGKKLTDDQVKFYWSALKDRPLPDVERRAVEVGKRSKFFPKPRDLRPIEADRETVESDPKRDGDFRALLDANARFWDNEIRERGDAAKLAIAHALMARHDVERDQSSPILAEKREWLTNRIRGLQRAVA